jgi:HAD superfamily hydrolase (TIGR01549 family)
MNNSLDKYLKENLKTHLIFDFDETIVKLLLPWDRAVIRIEEDISKLDPTIINDYKNRKISYAMLQNLYVEKYNDLALNLILKNNPAFETEELQGYLKNDGIIDFIKENNYKNFIWSSNTKFVIEKILEDLNILNKFSKIITREDVKFLKPSLDGFKVIDDKVTPVKNYLFIGDSWNDKDAAKQLNIDYYQEDFFKVPGKYW